MDNHRKTPWHAQTAQEVCACLQTDANGLCDAEAAERLKTNGPNVLRAKPSKSVWQMLREQLSDPMVLILIAASVLSAALQEWTEAAVIFLIVLVNAVIGIAQEKKAQSSLEALHSMGAPTARVLRQGEESIVPAAELVVGDVVLLSDGDMVPADLRLIDSVNLKVQEASLTGESVPVEKEADCVLAPDCLLAQRSNMAYSASLVTYGRAVGVVTETGMNTQVGQIAGMLDDQDALDTPLKRKLNSAGKTLTAIGLVICAVIFVIGMLYHRPVVPQLLVAVSLAISIIPEGLPAMATIVMALGVQRMAGKNTLVRRLPAVETLGSTTVICTDKTGTLTLNKMTVTQLASGADLLAQKTISPNSAVSVPGYMQLAYAAALCNDASFDPDRAGETIGDPTEGALLFLAQAFDLDHEQLEAKHPRRFEQPFDSQRKRMTTVHDMGGRLVAYTKGAVDELLPLCTQILMPQGVRPLTQADKNCILKLCGRMSTDALRVLGFAMRTLESVPEEGDDVENDLVFVGVAGMIDPPRREVAESVQICRRAGIRTVMITGDHMVTAQAIAKELGIYCADSSVVSGDALEKMTDSQLDHAVKTVSVFARVTPQDKLRIVQSLKRAGEVTAMTGDGVNDAPALKAADIGIAMGISGTDVAKDAADMILLDDRFTTIADAIREGRRVYGNIQKVIRFLLSGNIAEVLTLLVATILNWDAPLLAVHILWVNLATATLPALALGVDPADQGVMRRSPVRSGTLFEKDLVAYVLTQGAVTAAATVAAYWVGVYLTGHAAGRTMAFCVLALSQMLRAFDRRSADEPIRFRAGQKNIWLVLSFFISLVLTGAVLFIPALQSVFSLTALSIRHWLCVLALALFTFLFSFAIKAIRRYIKK
ncbi:MAG: cation-translocating P-type ATPase [Clostridiales bacterium]|nr:cation-translocating P-type ATPase [Clostridiales bacterium]